jgi:phosphinothricin acetyltransferase
MPPTIRPATEQDAASILAIYAPLVRETVVSFEVEPPTLKEMRRRIGETLISFPWLVCERESAVLGYAYATRHRARAAYQWSVDVSVYVDPRARRAGVGRALYRSLLAVLELQGFYNAYAAIALPNPASVALHGAVGFQPVGVYRAVGYKLGAWHDVGWWHRPLRAPSVPPAPPAAFRAIRESAECAAALASGASSLRPFAG